MLQGILPFERKNFANEVLAGITLAAIAIPEVMGYTKISGTPVITGLYTILFPALIFALIGSSKHLVVGADSATAAILASGLGALAITNNEQYLALAGMLALMAAAMLIVARIFELGFLANFLSSSVLIGFLSGVGVQVALGEFSGLFGMHGEGHNVFSKLVWFVQNTSLISYPQMALAIATLAFIICASLYSKKLPAPLVAVCLSILASWYFDFNSKSIAVLGELPSGLPELTITHFSLTFDEIGNLLTIAFSMFVVILAQSSATARAYAQRYDEKVDDNQNLLGLAAANIGAALSGTFVVNGSPTKTEILDSAGGRSQLAQIFSALTVLAVLLFLTAPLAYLPEVVLSTLVFLIGLKLIDFKGMKNLFQKARSEFWIALITGAIVVSFGVREGIFFALVTSLLDHVRGSYAPRTYVMTTHNKKTVFKPVSECAELHKGAVVYFFTHSIYYANIQAFEKDIETIETIMGDELKVLCIQSAAIGDIDYSAAQMLKSNITRLHKQGVRVVFAMVTPHVKKEMKRHGIHGLIGKENFVKASHELEKFM